MTTPHAADEPDEPDEPHTPDESDRASAAAHIADAIVAEIIRGAARDATYNPDLPGLPDLLDPPDLPGAGVQPR